MRRREHALERGLTTRDSFSGVVLIVFLVGH
jgi:hypothetical protein